VDKFAASRPLGAFGGRILRNPKGIAVDTAGRIVVADSGHNRIVQFSAAGVFLAMWGGRQLRAPEGVAAAPGNRLIVVDMGHDRIIKYAQTG
jgi:DNA-binding beta-propeller fold protein YncE